MTTPNEAPTLTVSDALKAELQVVKNTPVFQRGEAALRLAAMTIVAIERLGIRVAQLEESTDGT